MSNDTKPHEIKVPVLPESVSDAVVISWYKQPGEHVNRDEPIVDIETDKVVLEVPSPISGIVEQIFEQDGSTVVAQQVLGTIKETDESIKQHAPKEEPPEPDIEPPSQVAAPIESIITPAAKKMSKIAANAKEMLRHF